MSWILPTLFEARLELTPVPASRPRVPRYGKPYYSQPYAGYMEDAARALAPYVQPEPLSGLLSASLGFQIPRPPSHYRSGRNAHLLKDSAPEHPAGPRSGDLDNYCKAILDALQSAGIIEDDGLVMELTCAKDYGRSGLTFVRLEEWKGATAS